MGDYRSPNQLGSLAELLGVGNKINDSLREGNNQLSDEKKLRLKKQLDQEQQTENLKLAQDTMDQYEGKGKKANIGLTSGGGVTLGHGEASDLGDLIKFLGFKGTDNDRQTRKVERLQDDVTKSGAPQAVQSLKRVNKSIPGAFSGKAKFKSAGGWKNIVPNFAVPLAEKAGIMEPGSSDERTALQEAQNAKIYDSSGKQINEAEMKRIQDSMGLRGMFDPSSLNSALQQVGNTVLQKNKNITAGYPEETTQTFKSRGGMAGYGSLDEMLGGNANPGPMSTPAPRPDVAPVQQPQQPVDPELMELQQLRNKHKRR